MRLPICWLPLPAALLCSALALPLAAQQPARRPSPDEARAMLQADPTLVTKLRDRLASSGLTPDQVRARLRAEGYPEHLLDQYLDGAGASGPPNDSVFGAISVLGLPGDSAALRDDAARRQQRLRARAESVRANADSSALADSGRTMFGLSVFRQQTSMFDARTAGPVDESYVLGPGDQLVLILTGDVELAHNLEITREGFVAIPRVGQLYVANLTLHQLDALLASRLGRVFGNVGSGPNAATRFSVSVSRLHVNQVFVVGEAAIPGSYQVSSAGTALSALYAAGGPSANGSLRRVEVRRGGRTVDVLDVYDYLLRGDASHDVRLQNGDIVFVPVHGARVRVVGEVVRPATYELKPAESLSDLLRSAGGFTAEASQRRVLVERILPPGQRAVDGRDRVVLDVAADRLAAADGAPVRVEPGDVVRVFPVSERVRDRISVTGDVWAPGLQGFTLGMKLSEALQKAGGVRADAYLDNVLVTRLLPDSSRQQLRATLRDRSGAVVDDLLLQEDDEVRVFSSAKLRAEQFVTIGGAVREGGRFPYRVGMTVRDLVLLAGGPDESAYTQAEIARIPEDGAAHAVTARTFRVPVHISDVSVGRALAPGGAERPAAGAPPEDVVLQPHDNVLLLRRPDYVAPRSVVVAGEVGFPGRYTLVTRADRLTDVLRRAGGLTPEAYAEGTYFYRTEGRVGRVGIDLPHVLKSAGDRDNVLMQDGDSIFVPQYRATVDVRGAVNSPIAVAYVPGKSIGYYIAAAGGGSSKADLERAYVTQPNGKVESVAVHRLLPNGYPAPGAGASVYVPERDRSDRPNYAAIFGATAQVLGALVAIIAIAKR